MKIATWNVNSIKVRHDHVWQWCQEHHPDLIVLQEIKCLESQFPAEDWQGSGYYLEIVGQKTYHGVAIISKSPLVCHAKGLPFEHQQEARLLHVTSSAVDVIGVYVPNGKAIDSLSYSYKLSWLQNLTDYLLTLVNLSRPIICCGDFNIAPNDIDVYDPNSWEGILVSPAERSFFQQWMQQGWVDAFRRCYPDHPGYTWWDYRQGRFRRKQGLRIDHLLLNPAAAKLLDDCQVDQAPRGWERPSDHAPVWLKLA